MNFYLIGNAPRSFSPTIHSVLFAVKGLPHRYMNAHSLFDQTQFGTLFKQADFGGASVTIPYKSKMAKFLNQIHDCQGIVNTVVKRGDKIIGFNTDELAIRNLLEPHKNILKSSLIIGAGSTATVAGRVLKSMAISHCFYNRTQRLMQTGPLFTSADDVVTELERVGCFDLIFNAVPQAAEIQAPEQVIDKATLFFESNYIPENTKLLRRIGQQKRIRGIQMLIKQAIEQNQIFCEGKGKPFDKAEVQQQLMVMYRQSQDMAGSEVNSSQVM